MATLSAAQQNMVWLIQDTGKLHIPHYRENQRITAEALRKMGMVTIQLSDGGTWIVDLVKGVPVS